MVRMETQKCSTPKGGMHLGAHNLFMYHVLNLCIVSISIMSSLQHFKYELVVDTNGDEQEILQWPTHKSIISWSSKFICL